MEWHKQICGMRQADYRDVIDHMPDLKAIIDTFPDDPKLFSWDVKVHMLMPRQYPCIPHWHTDNVPRIGGVQRFEKCRLDLPMYLWVSGPPLTQFKHGYVLPETWHRFTQADEHRGTMSDSFTWRGFIRATHKIIVPVINYPASLRIHSQVYLDAETYQW